MLWLKNWNVSKGCCLLLSKSFCKAHLPVVDTTMVLEAETGERYEVKFLSRSCRLSGGWRRFSVSMKLEEGDAVVLHLVEVTKFKVYIIRANSSDEVNLPVHVFNLVVSRVKRSVSSKADRSQLFIYRRGEVQEYLQGKQREFKADKIRGNDTRVSQVLRKSRLVQVSKLIVGHPVTVKWLVKSYTSGSSLPLPTTFCRALLPLEDAIMTLETEIGVQYEIKYLAQHSILSGGWRKFAMHMKLEAGMLLFSTYEATKFKVYIIRKNANEVRLPVHILELLSHAERSVSSKEDSKHLIVYRRRKENQIAGNYSCKSARLNSRNAEGSMLLNDRILFSNIKSFEEFKAAIHELIQNHELPHYAIQEYYQLCCSQNAFLHADLFRGINTGVYNQIIVRAIRNIIFDTVNLANILSTCKLSTFLQKYESMDKALKTFEVLGMNVSFLRARLHHLKNLAVSSEGAADRIQYEVACHERGRAKGEVRKLELILAKLQALKPNPFEDKHREGNSWLEDVKVEISNLQDLIAELGEFFSQYDAHIETLKLKAKAHELKFQEEVSASWLNCPIK
ncbi:B3 domain-containing protein Os01g0234100-like [Chenopodium quinoa]|uniref:B3 domain-containing protein Os01g0234100-like n=1 Tax=Chenopodium quinoa TaxID=63459 RepID=UPI000B794A0F|nr:B3 domain-containing protein Os01g0234100-like [Chenopodium quinoa]